MDELTVLRKRLEELRGGQAALQAAVVVLLGVNKHNPDMQLQPLVDLFARQVEAMVVASTLSDDFLQGYQQSCAVLRKSLQ